MLLAVPALFVCLVNLNMSCVVYTRRCMTLKSPKAVAPLCDRHRPRLASTVHPYRVGVPVVGRTVFRLPIKKIIRCSLKPTAPQLPGFQAMPSARKFWNRAEYWTGSTTEKSPAESPEVCACNTYTLRSQYTVSRDNVYNDTSHNTQNHKHRPVADREKSDLTARKIAKQATTHGHGGGSRGRLHAACTGRRL